MGSSDEVDMQKIQQNWRWCQLRNEIVLARIRSILCIVAILFGYICSMSEMLNQGI